MHGKQNGWDTIWRVICLWSIGWVEVFVRDQNVKLVVVGEYEYDEWGKCWQ